MATRHLLLPLALLLGAAAPVQAAPAKPAADSPGVDIPYERYVLPNGLEVILHRDSAAPLVVTNLSVSRRQRRRDAR
ncbi:hypothetical protein [Nannocystis pusilla]|uniref:hypothetical protein n=1 Tax=Nannocystis pusilla TaxID=889268 RepID=UPI003DA40BEA